MRKKRKEQHRCYMCGRTLRDGNWIYSVKTGRRYCGEKQGHLKRSKAQEQNLRDSWPSLARQTDALVERIAA